MHTWLAISQIPLPVTLRSLSPVPSQEIAWS